MHDHTHHHPPHGHRHDDSMADLLDLDAEIHRTYFEELLDRVAGGLTRRPGTVVDIGAGTGAGTLALARRFPDAQLVALDLSTDMLGRLRRAADHNGFADRVRTVEVDLDAGLPDVGSVDLAWAALSLHHIEDPDTLLRQLFEAMEPGGTVVVTEMESQPRFLPDDIGIGTPGLEARCHEAAASRGWNTYPDWSDNLHRAGFEVMEKRHDELGVEVDETARRYAHAMLSRTRSGLADVLATEDLDTLDRLVAHGPESVLHRTDLSVRGSRTVWIARAAKEDS
ncbi:class I SAM-dependent methyltransferase [Rhodococcus sp. NPDC047139]|uniref:class I SAM-dependent methyltransferase n=1 Tax=Rhodococcus sp. NPDC047139 TaxID=3155141 RepID=UPI0033ED0866